MTIEELLNSDDNQVQEIATIVVEAKMAFENDELSQDQYNEIINDTFEFYDVKDAVDDANRKVYITKALKLLRLFSGVIK